MKSLRDYITETETWVDNPAQGDDFDIELAPDELLESYIVDVVEDGIVIAGDERVMGLLESFGHTTEEIRRYGAVGSNRGMGFTLEEDARSRVMPLIHVYYDSMGGDFWKWFNEPGNKEFFAKRAGVTPEQAYEVVDSIDWGQFPDEFYFDDEEDQDMREGMSKDDDFDRIMELAGCGRMREEEANTSDPLADKAAALAPVSAQGDQDPVDTIDEDGIDPVNQFGQDAEELEGNMTAEAEYQGRKVELNKPKRGGSKKFYVYVKDPKTGNIRKVSFGDPNMTIKKSNPARRKSFRARHRCDNPGPKTKARYWSCRSW